MQTINYELQLLLTNSALDFYLLQLDANYSMFMHTAAHVLKMASLALNRVMELILGFIERKLLLEC